MEHLIIIQCHKYEPAVRLGELLDWISENKGVDLSVLYAYDEVSPDWEKFEKLPNSIGFRIGYYTVDQGLYHLLLWQYISASDKYNSYDYYHIVSESDLPTKGILKIDEYVDGITSYGFSHRVMIENNQALNKAIAWYGVSNEVMKLICKEFNQLLYSAINIWRIYSLNPHIKSGFTGSFDEYLLGSLYWWIAGYKTDSKSRSLNHLNDCLRLVFWSDRKNRIIGYDSLSIECFGKLGGNYSSPISLLNTDATIYAFDNWKVLFARKFEFNSPEYNFFYNRIKE